MLPSLSGGRQGRRSLCFRVAAMQGTLCRRSCSWVHGSTRAPRRRRRAGVCFPNDDLSRRACECRRRLADGGRASERRWLWPSSLLPAVAQGRLLRRVVGAASGTVGISALLLAARVLRGEARRRLSEPPPGKQVFWPRRAHPGRAAPRPSGGVVWLLRQQGVSRRPPSLRSSLRSSARMTRSKSRRLLT